MGRATVVVGAGVVVGVVGRIVVAGADRTVAGSRGRAGSDWASSTWSPQPAAMTATANANMVCLAQPRTCPWWHGPAPPGVRVVEAADRRRQAARAGHTGDAAAARALLHDPVADVRATALGALSRLGAVTAGEVAEALADEHHAVRRRACEVGARVDGVDLLPLLADVDGRVIEVAAWALGERESATTETVDALAAVATGHSDALCREAAVAALGAIGDERGLPAILAATTDKATVRRRAVISLAPFSGADVDAALESALSDRDWQVRQAAQDLSGRP